MAVKTYGIRRFREVIDQCLDLTEFAARLFEKSPRLAIVTPPSLGIFTFRYVPQRLPQTVQEREELLNRLNAMLMEKIISSRQLMLSSTLLESRRVLRFCVLNHRTRKEDIREALKLIEDFGQEVEQSIE
jgi:aromatic-L-amino-acid/L-tryptophan decarboxylase